MIAYNFRTPGNGAGGGADEGRRELAHPTPASAYAAARLTYRAHHAPAGERAVLDHLHAALDAHFPRSLITSYYVSLKTNPFVVLTGREGTGKAAFVHGFANALLGAESGQFVAIGSARWAQRSGERSYYLGLHERFGSLQFLETLQEAAAPEHAGKLYMLMLRGLSIEELHHYFQELLRIGPGGEQLLALPGVPAERHPVLPPNILITATLHLPRLSTKADEQALRNVAQIEFPPDLRAPAVTPAATITPPVGFQRAMLASAVRDPELARARLEAALGRRELRRLGPSPELAAALWRMGMPLGSRLLDDVLVFVANSFDGYGRGLFDPERSTRNAQLAFDCQLAQRLLGRAGGRRANLRRRIAAIAEL